MRLDLEKTGPAELQAGQAIRVRLVAPDSGTGRHLNVGIVKARNARAVLSSVPTRVVRAKQVRTPAVTGWASGHAASGGPEVSRSPTGMSTTSSPAAAITAPPATDTIART